jgi:hypothetical protein
MGCCVRAIAASWRARRQRSTFPNRTKQPSLSVARPKRTDSDVLAVRNRSARWRCP